MQSPGLSSATCSPSQRKRMVSWPASPLRSKISAVRAASWATPPESQSSIAVSSALKRMRMGVLLSEGKGPPKWSPVKRHFMAALLMPVMMYFCRKRKSSTIGMIAMTAPAMISL